MSHDIPAVDPPPLPHASPPRATASGRTVSIVLAASLIAVLVVGGALIWRAESKVNKVSLSASPKPVSVTVAKAKAYQASRTYVGTLEPWLAANVGPQLVAAYIDTVLVRPGAVAKQGEVLATLDCRDANAASLAVAGEARAIDARQKALANEAARVQDLLAGHFVSPNEAEQKSAQSTAQAAELDAMKAKLSHSTLKVNDCILRAPFDGEVAIRTMDPGGFVRPGMSILSIVDRGTVRLTADVPEIDFDVVPPGTAVRVYVPATKQEIAGVISRRAPAADPATRTVHFEVDLADAAHRIPVGTTGEAHLEVGQPEPATEIPIYAANVRGDKATVFVVEGDVAHSRSVHVKGEIGGSLFLDNAVPPGTQVVTEGRAVLADGDHVSAKVEPDLAPTVAPSTTPVADAPPGGNDKKNRIPSPAGTGSAESSSVLPVKATILRDVKEHHP